MTLHHGSLAMTRGFRSCDWESQGRTKDGREEFPDAEEVEGKAGQ